MAKLPGAIQGARIVGERFINSQRRVNPEGRMPVMDHLRELRNRVVKAIIPVRNGFFDIPDAPGLGVELDEAGIATVPVMRRDRETARREDGAIAFR